MELYIIGNGFDINNGLPTRYSDFSKWVKENYPDEHRKISELFSLNDLWSEFEDNIGDCYENIENIYDEEYSSFELNCDSYTEEWRMDDDRSYAVEYGMQDRVVNNTTLSKFMKEWLIGIINDYKQKTIYTEEAIINFNYTDYIRGKNVLYIHGSVSSGMTLQVGHSKTRLLEEHFTRTNRSDFGNRYPDRKAYFNQLTKFPHVSMQKLKGFLYTKHITKLIFFGFSFGDQDISYFNEFDNNTPVEFYLEESSDNRKAMHNIKNIFNNVTFKDAKDWNIF